MNKVLIEKYEFSDKDANNMSDFLVPILNFVPEKRPTAAQCLLHPWINAGPHLLEPSVPVDRNAAADFTTSDKTKEENDELEAVDVGVRNIAISS